MFNPTLYSAQQNIANARFILGWALVIPLLTWGLALRMDVVPSGGLLTGVILGTLVRCLLQRYYRQHRPNRQQSELIFILSTTLTIEWVYGLNGMLVVTGGYVLGHLLGFWRYARDQRRDQHFAWRSVILTVT